MASEGIARITINRPQRLGAYTPRMCAEILDALRTVRLDDAIRVLVLTGTGRGFCTGGDISPDAGFSDALDHQIGRARELVQTLPSGAGGSKDSVASANALYAGLGR